MDEGGPVRTEQGSAELFGTDEGDDVSCNFEDGGDEVDRRGYYCSCVVSADSQQDRVCGGGGEGADRCDHRDIARA